MSTMDWSNEVDFSNPTKAAEQFQRILENQRQHSQAQLQIEEIKQNYTEEFNKLKAQLEEQRSVFDKQREALDNEREELMEKGATRALTQFKEGGNGKNGGPSRLATQSSSDDLLASGTPAAKRFSAGNKNSLRNNKFARLEKQPLISEVFVPNSTSIANQNSVSNGDDEMTRSDVTNDNGENTNAWQPVLTNAQKKTAKKSEKNKVEKMETDKLRCFGSELVKKVCSNGVVLQRLGENQCPRIVCDTEEAKQKVIAHLTAGRIEFNSFNNKETKRRAFIIRVMLGESDDEAMRMIENAIRSTGIDLTLKYLASSLHTNDLIHRPAGPRCSRWLCQLALMSDYCLAFGLSDTVVLRSKQ